MKVTCQMRSKRVKEIVAHRFQWKERNIRKNIIVRGFPWTKIHTNSLAHVFGMLYKSMG